MATKTNTKVRKCQQCHKVISRGGVRWNRENFHGACYDKLRKMRAETERIMRQHREEQERKNALPKRSSLKKLR